MLESNPFNTAVTTEQLLSASDAAANVRRQRAPRLDLNRLVRHPRLEPLVRRLFPDQRKHDRIALTNVVGYVGRLHASRPHRIADISVGGFRMMSDQLWTPGTEMTITLQREEWDGDESSQCLTGQAVVVRCVEQEMGFSIALLDENTSAPSNATNDSLRIEKRTVEQFLADLQRPKMPRSAPVLTPKQRPLLLSERTELLLELAGSYRLSAASELWYAESGSLLRTDRGEPARNGLDTSATS